MADGEWIRGAGGGGCVGCGGCRGDKGRGGGLSAGADIQPAPHERLVLVGQRSLGRIGGEGLLSSAVLDGTRPIAAVARFGKRPLRKAQVNRRPR